MSNNIAQILRAIADSIDEDKIKEPKRGALVLFDVDNQLSVYGMGGEDGEGMVVTKAMLSRSADLIDKRPPEV